MVAEKDIIVALELASTAIRAVAGRRMPDGSMQVLAYAEENAANCIRKGIIDNIDKTTQAITRVIGQVGIQLGHTVSRVYVGLGGQSLHSVHNRIQRTFSEKTQITNRLIDQLMDTNLGVVYTDSVIMEVIPQEYKVGTRSIFDIVGMQVEQMDANFLNIIARTSLAENIEKCVRGAGLEIAELLITPLALGDSILSAAEKRSGCALVDIGADTTTVSVYTSNILRKLVVIPLGSNNVTLDVANCLTTEADEAESLKLKYGRARLEDYDAVQGNILKISHSREVNEARLCEIVEARMEEILRNVWAQIEDDSDKLTSGVVITGGGAQMRNVPEAFQLVANNNKPIRMAKGYPADVAAKPDGIMTENGRTNSILSLLLHGDQNCISLATEQDPSPEEANDDPANVTPAEDSTAPAVSTDSQEKPDDENDVDNTKGGMSNAQKFWGIIKKALSDE